MSLQNWLLRIERLHPSNIELGLERVAHVYQRLVSRTKDSKTTVITVAGTNGKGSTVECLTQCLLVQNLRVGTYTSPHLIRFNERVVIDGHPVSDSELVKAFDAVEVARGETALTYFEFTTLAALWLFDQTKLDFWVLEVGLGGRLDAVNVVDADVAVITSIGLDHQDWLGDTREQIATEKCGIMKRGAFAVCSDPKPPANVQSIAVAQGCELYRLGEEFCWDVPICGGQNDHSAISRVSWRSNSSTRADLQLPKNVASDNLAGALAALDLLEILPTSEQINQVFARWALAGRQQIVPGEVEWWMDVAHNPDSAKLLAESLRRHPIKGKTYLVIGMLADKAVAEVLEILMPHIDQCIVVDLDSSRALSAEALVALLPTSSATSSLVLGSVAAGCSVAQARADEGDRVVVTGSFHAVGPALAWLGL